MKQPGWPEANGLFDPSNEKDACGVGFICDLKGRKSHKIVADALEVLIRMTHRGACGCEPNTGDGAGILIQLPDRFLRKVYRESNHRELPPAGRYAAGIVFLPRDPQLAKNIQHLVEQQIEAEGQILLGWRDVPVDNATLGQTALNFEPAMKMLFIGAAEGLASDLFDRRLFFIRKLAYFAIAQQDVPGNAFFYIPSLSAKTMIFKGMLTPEQVPVYFKDLQDPELESALGMVHSRFSTNTFPAWKLAQPFRMLSHNGEINTLRGNINWMRARERLFTCEFFSNEEYSRILPLLMEDNSDSAILDNALELLVMGGRDLASALMMMIPEAWANHETMSQEKKDFYAFHQCLMEPWDGPASVAVTDGTVIGAVLDRNGLRPSRFYVTHDDRVIMASEVGVVDIAPEEVKLKGRLQPGRMFLVDMNEGRIVPDEEIKHRVVTAKPYGKWLKENLVRLEDLPQAPHVQEPDHKTVFERQQAFGYTVEDLRILLKPMAADGYEALGSMGTDTPLAVLSDQPQLLYNYFKQLFAQVTNPPLDAIREEVVTDVGTTIGREGNLLAPTPESCRHIYLSSPILDNDRLATLKNLDRPGFRSITIPILFKAPARTENHLGTLLERAMDTLCQNVEKAIDDGNTIVILSDRGVNRQQVPIPALLACAGVHHHLVRQGKRSLAGLVLESGEPREVHHFAVLIGYGVQAINPYLAFESIDDMIRDHLLQNIDHKHAVKNYIKAVIKGVVKVMSKMGISTIQSYRGAQIFEAIGIGSSVIEKYFTKTTSRIEGVSLQQIAAEQLARHRRAYPERDEPEVQLAAGGHYQWRRDGEFHMMNPKTVHLLQRAVREGNYKHFLEYAKQIDEQGRRLCTLRGLMRFKPDRAPVPIDEVEAVDSLVKRFCTGAMSYGSISKEAHETLAIAMNRLGASSNTGEGGEDYERFTPDENGDSRMSAIKQVASGRFGVTSRYLVNSRELQIKIAQGAKPGEGGQLQSYKVWPWIAKTRHTTPFVGLISPPPHHDIYSIEDLAQLIHDLKNANVHARVSVKLVSEVGVGTVAAGVAKAKADHVLISGYEGGTGASPLTSIKHAGAPWELGLAETHQVLVQNDLRDRIVVQTDGMLRTGRDLAIAAMLGAEEFGFGTIALIAEGCIMMRVCHLDTCPVGVATQNPELRKKFTGKPEHVINFMRFIAQNLREHMAALGFRRLTEMVGQSQCLELNEKLAHWKAQGLDYRKILHKPVPKRPDAKLYCVQPQDHGIALALDNELLAQCQPAIKERKPVRLERPIRNVNRVVGTMLGSEVTRHHPEGLPDETICIKFTGSAGQSFGAFIPKGIALELEGDSNDYFAKGLSGGRCIVYPHKNSTFQAEENIIVGNVVAYGATEGEIFVRGMAGERFCVRNSGAHAVVEGVGDHGCEYMTGGYVVVLGKTGRNFAAGMSGGVAFVLDEVGNFPIRCNREMVELEPVEQTEDLKVLKTLLEKHLQYTGSTVAKRVLLHWDAMLPRFVRVMPTDYKRALAQLKTGQLTPAVAD